MGNAGTMLTDHQWATEVMTIISSRPAEIRLGPWSEVHRGQIVHHLTRYRQEPGFLELVVDNLFDRRWRLHAAPGRVPGVRLREHPSNSATTPEPDGLATINDALARLGDGRHVTTEEGAEPGPGSAVRDRNGEVWAYTNGHWRVAGSTGYLMWCELVEAGAPLILLVDGPTLTAHAEATP